MFQETRCVLISWWIPYIVFSEILEKVFRGVSGTGPVEPQGMTCACGMYVHCTLLHTCPLALLAHANFAQPCQRGSRNIPIFEIKEYSIVKMHSCGSKEAKMRSRNAISDSKQKNSIFKYHWRAGFAARLTITWLNHSVRCCQLSLGSGTWHAGRGPTPGMTNIFSTPEKIFSKLFLIGWIPYIARGTILEKFFLAGLRHRASGATRPWPVPVACMYIVHYYTHVHLHCWHMPILPRHVRGRVKTFRILK